MAVSFSGYIKVSPDVLFRQLGEDGVLVNLKTERYLGLNPTGARMWDVLSRASSVEAAYDELLREYQVEPAELRADLQRFIAELVDQHLVEAVSA